MRLPEKGASVLLGVLLIALLASAVAAATAYFLTAVQKSTPQEPERTIEQPTPNPKKTLTPEEQEVLNIPGPNASVEERLRHQELVLRLAKQVGVVDITGCQPTPVVFRLFLNERIHFKNDDSAPHQLVFNENSRYTIPAETTATIVADFAQRGGIYGFACDHSGRSVGLVVAGEEHP